MLTNWLSPTERLRSRMASTVSPLMAWNVLVRPRTSIRAMSPRQIRVVDVLGHGHVALQEAELVEPRQRVLEILGHEPGVSPAIHVLLGQVELLEHGLRSLEARVDHVDDGVA